MEERKFVILTEFIDCYKNNPQLWNIHSPNYANKMLREQGYKELLKVYQKVKREAVIEDVKQKINVLRFNYQKMLKKVQESEASAKCNKDVFKPTVRWFHSLDFLKEIDKPKDSFSVTSTTAIKRSFSDNEGSSSDDEAVNHKKQKIIKENLTHLHQSNMWLKWSNDFDACSKKQKVLVESAINDIFRSAANGTLSCNIPNTPSNVQNASLRSNNLSDEDIQKNKGYADIEQGTMDGIEYVFVGLAKIIKTFSARRQAAIKLNIATIVMENELEQHEENEIAEN